MSVTRRLSLAASIHGRCRPVAKVCTSMARGFGSWRYCRGCDLKLSIRAGNYAREGWQSPSTTSTSSPTKLWMTIQWAGTAP
jgi:hypothetical protein